MHFSVEIPPDHPALPGHFPGMPVVPAVVLIEHLAFQLKQLVGVSVSSVKQLRLLDPVQPGQSVEVAVSEKGGESWRLTCSVGDKTVAKGVLSSRKGEPEEVGPYTRTQTPPDYRSARELYRQLPHAGSMQLVDELALYPSGAQTQITVDEHHPLVSGRCLPTWVMLEYAAQLMACRKLTLGGEPLRKAVVVMVRSLECVQPSVPVGETVDVCVTEDVAQPGAVQCRFSACMGGKVIAGGAFTVVSEG